MKILLHICCAPCSTEVIDKLRNEGYEVTGFFYNPNIQPRKEYEIRLAEAKKYSKLTRIELIEGDYDDKIWFFHTSEYKSEPEGGTRCEICFKMRLEKTGEVAEDKGIPLFTSTLSISPYKNSRKLNEIGKLISEKLNTEYLESDFKKQDGYKKSLEKSREAKLYRQDYCGCIYSKSEVNKKK